MVLMKNGKDVERDLEGPGNIQGKEFHGSRIRFYFAGGQGGSDVCEGWNVFNM